MSNLFGNYIIGFSMIQLISVHGKASLRLQIYDIPSTDHLMGHTCDTSLIIRETPGNEVKIFF